MDMIPNKFVPSADNCTVNSVGSLDLQFWGNYIVIFFHIIICSLIIRDFFNSKYQKSWTQKDQLHLPFISWDILDTVYPSQDKGGHELCLCMVVCSCICPGKQSYVDNAGHSMLTLPSDWISHSRSATIIQSCSKTVCITNIINPAVITCRCTVMYLQ